MTERELAGLDSIQRAELTLTDIAALQALPAFDRYMMGAIRRRRDAASKAVLDDDKLTPEQREQQRQVYKALKQLAEMPQTDWAASQNTINSSRPTAAPS